MAVIWTFLNFRSLVDQPCIGPCSCLEPMGVSHWALFSHPTFSRLWAGTPGGGVLINTWTGRPWPQPPTYLCLTWLLFFFKDRPTCHEKCAFPIIVKSKRSTPTWPHAAVQRSTQAVLLLIQWVTKQRNWHCLSWTFRKTPVTHHLLGRVVLAVLESMGSHPAHCRLCPQWLHIGWRLPASCGGWVPVACRVVLLPPSLVEVVLFDQHRFALFPMTCFLTSFF